MTDKPYQIGWANAAAINSDDPVTVARVRTQDNSVAVFATPVGNQDIRVAVLREVADMLSAIEVPDDFAAALKQKLVDAESIVTFDDTRAHGAGRPHKCFYCSGEVGKVHDDNCVCLTKRVRYRVTLELENDEPRSWDKAMCEFARNQGTWCADNVGDWIDRATEKNGCLCGIAKFEVIEIEQA